MALMTIRTTSERSTARKARIILYLSIGSSILPFRRMPAVSIKRKFCPSVVTGVSIASLVVPATSLTIERVSPTNVLKIDDLPTLGRPIIATLITSSSASPDEASTGNLATIASNKSPKLM